MIRYLPTYTAEEKWSVLKESDVRDVQPVIEGLELLRERQQDTDFSFDDVRDFKAIEKEHLEDIQALNDEDQEVLETSIQKTLYKSERLLYKHPSHLFFVMNRAEDFGVFDAIEPMLLLIEKAKKVMTQLALFNGADHYTEQLNNLLEEWDETWPDVKTDIEHLSPTTVQFFETAFNQRQREKVLRCKEHFSENVFGKWLLTLRNERGWSLAKAEKASGLSKQSIAALEKGQNDRLNVTQLMRLADVYDLSFGTMFSMAKENVSSVQALLGDAVYNINDQSVSSKQRDEIVQLFEHISNDDMVAAHQTLDEIGLLFKH